MRQQPPAINHAVAVLAAGATGGSGLSVGCQWSHNASSSPGEVAVGVQDDPWMFGQVELSWYGYLLAIITAGASSFWHFALDLVRHTPFFVGTASTRPVHTRKVLTSYFVQVLPSSPSVKLPGLPEVQVDGGAASLRRCQLM